MTFLDFFPSTALIFLISGIPVWVGRKLYARYEHANKHKRNLAIAGGVTAAVSTDQIFSLLFLHVFGNRVNEKKVVTVLNWFFTLLQQ